MRRQTYSSFPCAGQPGPLAHLCAHRRSNPVTVAEEGGRHWAQVGKGPKGFCQKPDTEQEGGDADTA
ncbi:hypothetical protein GOP47_0013466 [Adiantum capillus-veneris]|uniref:Uncharacterized protein n=1 Tax=Adiantum capillus-veneris TaxID=13818 RepID=A0A9D4ZFC1_ADICA|nr:hypothetical protein GOP47_0013466 [Adiantum capillus-veneris]